MKEKINEVREYFKTKILKGEFDVIKISDHEMRLLVDKEYKFSIWVGNRNIPGTMNQYHSFGNENFIDLGLTNEDCIKLQFILDPILEDNYRKVIIRQKRKQFEELKKELNITE